MTYRPVRGVSLLDVVEYLGTRTKSVKSVVVRNGVTGDFEDAWMHSANVANCVETLAKQKNLPTACDALGKFARKAGVKQGALTVAVLRSYFPWCHANPDNAVDRQKQCEANCKCGLHGLLLGADRGIFEVYETMRRLVRTLPAWAEKPKAHAATLLADAEVVLSEWVERWNRDRDLTTHITIAQFAKEHGIHERVVRKLCESGRLPAKKISQPRGGLQWVIDVTEFAEHQENSLESISADIAKENGLSIVDEP